MYKRGGFQKGKKKKRLESRKTEKGRAVTIVRSESLVEERKDMEVGREKRQILTSSKERNSGKINGKR